MLQQQADGQHLVLRYCLGNIVYTAQDIVLGKNKAIRLQISGEPDYYHFAYSVNGGNTYTDFGAMDAKYLSTETAGGFTGVVLGLFSTTQTKNTKAQPQFSDFVYNGK